DRIVEDVAMAAEDANGMLRIARYGLLRAELEQARLAHEPRDACRGDETLAVFRERDGVDLAAKARDLRLERVRSSVANFDRSESSDRDQVAARRERERRDRSVSRERGHLGRDEALEDRHVLRRAA